MRSLAISTVLLATASSAFAADAPTFKSTSIKAPFIEQFDAGWDSRWQSSEATKKTPVGDETYSYVGKWKVELPSEPLILGDEGLVAKNKAAHHAISAKFNEPVTFTEPLVVQYEVKYQKGGNCGGGYVKLLEQKFFDGGNEFDDKAPWTIMFGPDLTCPGSKIHFIFQHTNPVTGVKEEKQINAAPNPSFGSDTNLYTLIVNPDNTYEILFNNESKKAGSLLEDFMPPVNPEKEIDDPEDSKPSTWVDQQQIPDPEATKPEDWDEDAPLEIPDLEAEKPEGWLDSEPATIPDPDATQPEEWDDEEDGDWIAPTVANPACIEGPGCGEWKRPTIRNPDYKGKWYAPYIDNPEYKGVWAPRKIANPAYFEDKSPFHSLAAIGGIGIELWTMTEDILFDNVYVGRSVADAKAFAEETYAIKAGLEKVAADKIVGEETEDKIAALKKDPAAFIQSEVFKFIDLVQVDPILAIKSEPITAGALVLAIFTLFGMIGTLVGMVGGGAAPSKPAPAKADAKVPAVNAKSTAVAEKDESALKKRK